MSDEYIYWKDIDLSLTKDATGDVADQENKYAILNSVYNILSTQPGDRRMMPTFACDIRGLLFEPIDDITASNIADRLADALKTWEPRISITEVTADAYPDDSMYNIKLSFSILTTNDNVTIEFPLIKY